MPYWHRPKFWLILIALQIPGFLLAAIITTAIALFCVTVHIASDHTTLFPFVAFGFLLNIYFAFEAFRFARNRTGLSPPPQPRGFPVILNDSDESPK